MQPLLIIWQMCVYPLIGSSLFLISIIQEADTFDKYGMQVQ
jgi:hypothetical protein